MPPVSSHGRWRNWVFESMISPQEFFRWRQTGSSSKNCSLDLPSRSSHFILAAEAAGANCILLFGPTNPEIWAPKNEKVQVIRAPTGDMPSLRFETVRDALINRLKAYLPGK